MEAIRKSELRIVNRRQKENEFSQRDYFLKVFDRRSQDQRERQRPWLWKNSEAMRQLTSKTDECDSFIAPRLTKTLSIATTFIEGNKFESREQSEPR